MTTYTVDSRHERELTHVRELAFRRAENSERPWLFLEAFDDSLHALLVGDDLLDLRWDVSDPVKTAAEIEALAAHRAFMFHGTEQGLCRPHWPKKNRK